ncbi:glycosyltransferase family 4 protein [Planctomycetales bacterium ZRK34]|nr:glycosyltransferase family 4 protein [Planctomycetales bacterium ZRK34]
MRIVQLTPGTGNFHCGSCLRDNVLVSALRRMGHDVMMVPLYLPHVVDTEALPDDTPIFFGGISVYLEQKLAMFRHTPRWFDRLLARPTLLNWAANRSGMTSARDLGELTVSMLKGEHGKQNKELTHLIDWLKTQGPVDVVCLSNAMLLGMARRLGRELNTKVVCTLAGEDAFLDTLIEPYQSQAWSLLRERVDDAAALIAVSRYYADQMRQRLKLADDDDRLRVVYNGIELDGYTPAEAPPADPTIGYLARLHPGKGMHTLVEAFIEMKRRGRVSNLKLRLAGAKKPEDDAFVNEQREALKTAGVIEHASIEPNLTESQKLDFYRSISTFSVPATYGEAFGLYVLEALAAGVPVVQPRHGAFTELLEQLGGGILCEADSPTALADALEITLLRHDESRQSAATARQHVLKEFNVDRMAAGVADVFEQVTVEAA